jgi:F-type H+-transporting ATPase subunit delta
MRYPIIARRYANALFDLAVESGLLETVKQDIEAIRPIIRHPELREVFLSPVIRGEKKKKIFDAIFKGKINPLTQSFFDLVLTKGREIAFPEIVNSLQELYLEHEGIVKLQITTSAPISDELKEEILKRFQARPRFQEKTLVVEHKVDENIIGGFVAQAGDLLYDASIRNDLRYIKKQFVENMYVMRIR